MDQFDQYGGWREEPPRSRRRVWVTSGALVGSGLVAGAILAGTLSANAVGGTSSSSALVAPAAATSTGTATPTDPDGPDSVGPGHGWWGRWGDGGAGVCDRGPGASVPDDTAAKVKDAVVAKYPGATIRWVRSDADGGYVAYIDTADGKDLAVRLDGSFAITGTDELPGPHGWWGSGGNSVSDTTATQVKDAVVAKYPGATIRWVRSDPDGGYVAYAKTADDKGVVVHLNDSFAITGTESVPGC
jgi:hypothetical protein